MQNHIDVTSPPDKQPFDYVVKTIIIGDAGVGKTSILRQFTESIFNVTRESTIGIDFGTRRLQIQDPNAKKILVTPHMSSNDHKPDGLHKLVKNPTYNFQIWDCAGQERFRSIVAQYLRGAKVVFLTFDLTDRVTFNNLDDWIKEIEIYLGDPSEEAYVLIVVGNKKDLHDRRQVDSCEGHELARKLNNAIYFEISAKDAASVYDVFQFATQKVYKLHIAGKLHFQHRTFYDGMPTLEETNTTRCLPILDCTIL